MGRPKGTKYIETPEKEYKVLEDLSIINTKTKRVLKPWLNANGYKYVDVKINGIRKKIAIHRLIAEEFITNVNNKKQINHKDGNKLNNSLDNLEWCSASENLKHAYKTGLKKIPNSQIEKCRTMGLSSRKKVINPTTNEVYNSVKEASKRIGISRSYLSAMLNGIKPNTTHLILKNV